MKIQRVKIVTFSSLFILLCLQVVWSVYTYKEQYHKLEKVSNSVFYTSTLSDIIKRSETYMPEGAELLLVQFKRTVEIITPVCKRFLPRSIVLLSFYLNLILSIVMVYLQKAYIPVPSSTVSTPGRARCWKARTPPSAGRGDRLPPIRNTFGGIVLRPW